MEITYHYKSWKGLKKQLENFLCDSLRERITYQLARYHKVHNSYGKASICLDRKELAAFSWNELYEQDAAFDVKWREIQEEQQYENVISMINALSDTEIEELDDSIEQDLRKQWNESGTLNDTDFLDAAVRFCNRPIAESLVSEEYLLKVFAIMDKRLGKRTLSKMKSEGAYLSYPAWVKQFYELRFEVSGI
ncbi:MAG: hypothetical protein IJ711_05530 [Lachnospiraceae bacterium]|nr:hypothetical protein [Lachnospiraceae bacterium]